MRPDRRTAEQVSADMRALADRSRFDALLDENNRLRSDLQYERGRAEGLLAVIAVLGQQISDSKAVAS